MCDRCLPRSLDEIEQSLAALFLDELSDEPAQAAHIILSRALPYSRLKTWAMQVAKRRGLKRAKVACARKLAVILHRMWRDGTDFIWSSKEAAA